MQKLIVTKLWHIEPTLRYEFFETVECQQYLSDTQRGAVQVLIRTLSNPWGSVDEFRDELDKLKDGGNSVAHPPLSTFDQRRQYEMDLTTNHPEQAKEWMRRWREAVEVDLHIGPIGSEKDKKLLEILCTLSGSGGSLPR